jgi:hypothetical protein
VVAPAFVLLVTVSLKTIYTAAEKAGRKLLLSKNNSPNYSGRIENPIRSSPPVRRFKFQVVPGVTPGSSPPLGGGHLTGPTFFQLSAVPVKKP